MVKYEVAEQDLQAITCINLEKVNLYVDHSGFKKCSTFEEYYPTSDDFMMDFCHSRLVEGVDPSDIPIQSTGVFVPSCRQVDK